MTLRRYAKKRDTVEPAIVEALERAGFEVWRIDLCDLIVRRQSWPPGRVQLLECKTPYGKKAPRARLDKRQEAQANFLSSTGTPIVTTPLEALRALGAVSNGASQPADTSVGLGSP